MKSSLPMERSGRAPGEIFTISLGCFKASDFFTHYLPLHFPTKFKHRFLGVVHNHRTIVAVLGLPLPSQYYFNTYPRLSRNRVNQPCIMGELPAPTVDPETGYFQAPYSVHGFSSSQQRGIIAIVCMAFLSVLATAFTIIRIAITRCTREDPDHHQFITLVFNLQIADFFQALSFTISTVWLHNEGILAPDLACSVQGFFLNLGDVSSGLFVLLIALQTNYTVRRGVTLPPRILWIIVGLIWSLAFGMSIGGIIRLPHEFYTAAGNWVSS